MENKSHPSEPQSNIPKLKDYDPNKYALDNVSLTVLTHEDLTPNRPPCLTQYTIGKYLQPLTRELVEVPLAGVKFDTIETRPIPGKPTVDELADNVIDRMVERDKAFWVDKPGANAYNMHDTFNRCGMKTEAVRPPHQDVFPRSYQYDLDCVKYRRQHVCDVARKQELTDAEEGFRQLKSIPALCRRDCHRVNVPRITPFQLACAEGPGQTRWRDYPDLTATPTKEEIRQRMNEFGRPFKHEACTWYNENYPSMKYDVILRKFAK